MRLLASSFEEGQPIPSDYTCDGTNISPALKIEEVPIESKSLALIVEDPDAQSKDSWVHWIMWNIPPSTNTIEQDTTPSGAVEGLNDFNRTKYGGPCPPTGIHRYFFKLYALDCLIDLPNKSNRPELLAKMAGHIIDEAVLMGTYEKIKSS